MNINKKSLIKWININEPTLIEIAKKIWESPEIPFREKSAAHLQSTLLKKAGFKISKIRNMPTAFVAEYGKGNPIIGVLGEYDALPGLSQKVSYKQEPVVKGAAGHGCGHNLLGTAGVGAVLAIKDLLEKKNIHGTIRYYGCPAEETLAGKPFMAREGVFDDLDACITWHPGFINTAWGGSQLAMNSVVFSFKGISSHASATPELGRSALDAVELMNIGSNYLREHVIDKARIHYTITNGGDQPNIVPAEASVWYYIRAPKREDIDDIFKRLTKIAEGAALMTETSVEWEFKSACYDVLPNHTLNDLLLKNMEKVGAPTYTEGEKQFALQLLNTISEDQKETIREISFVPDNITVDKGLHEGVTENIDKDEILLGSTDVGDVSWITPTGQFTTVCWPLGVSNHSWQATASAGSNIGMKGMLFASKVIAITLFDLVQDNELIEKATKEFNKNRNGKKYECPIPKEIQPPMY